MIKSNTRTMAVASAALALCMAAALIAATVATTIAATARTSARAARWTVVAFRNRTPNGVVVAACRANTVAATTWSTTTVSTA